MLTALTVVDDRVVPGVDGEGDVIGENDGLIWPHFGGVATV